MERSGQRRTTGRLRFHPGYIPNVARRFPNHSYRRSDGELKKEKKITSKSGLGKRFLLFPGPLEPSRYSSTWKPVAQYTEPPEDFRRVAPQASKMRVAGASRWSS